MAARLTFASRCSVASTAVRDAFRQHRPRLSLLTDFGSGDEAVYSVKSAALAVCPRANVSDICHNVPPWNILIGAHRLKRAATLPTERKGTVYVAVVDPGVGTSRKDIIVETCTGKYLVGPDNGVLSLAFAAEGIRRAVEIERKEFTLLHLAQSRTFHGRDVLAPAAAHLLRGVPIGEFGKELDRNELARITISSGATDRGRSGDIVDIDGFGSIRTNVPNHVPDWLVGRNVGFFIRGTQSVAGNAKVVRTFAEAGAGQPVLVQSSTGCLDLAVSRGSASGTFGIRENDIGLDAALRPGLRIEVDFL